jgi:hypothetical protein
VIEPNGSWPALLALGAAHGLNPAMGWLFAVALGLQRESRRAVWASLGPLAAGHFAAIGLALAGAVVMGLVLPLELLRWVTGALLIGLGIYRLIRTRHPRFGGMLVNGRDLALWSFLMASAHGAGLMVLPLVMGQVSAATMASPVSGHMLHQLSALPALTSVESTGIWATLVHTAGYFLVTAVLAVIVYEKVGVRFLRKAWVNIDLIWAVALLVTGVAMVA